MCEKSNIPQPVSPTVKKNIQNCRGGGTNLSARLTLSQKSWRLKKKFGNFELMYQVVFAASKNIVKAF
jgi:hypothetical protein